MRFADRYPSLLVLPRRRIGEARTIEHLDGAAKIEAVLGEIGLPLALVLLEPHADM
jgi:hypothetical protein